MEAQGLDVKQPLRRVEKADLTGRLPRGVLEHAPEAAFREQAVVEQRLLHRHLPLHEGPSGLRDAVHTVSVGHQAVPAVEETELDRHPVRTVPSLPLEAARLEGVAGNGAVRCG